MNKLIQLSQLQLKGWQLHSIRAHSKFNQSDSLSWKLNNGKGTNQIATHADLGGSDSKCIKFSELPYKGYTYITSGDSNKCVKYSNIKSATLYWAGIYIDMGYPISANTASLIGSISGYDQDHNSSTFTVEWRYYLESGSYKGTLNINVNMYNHIKSVENKLSSESKLYIYFTDYTIKQLCIKDPNYQGESKYIPLNIKAWNQLVSPSYDNQFAGVRQISR